MFSAGVVKAATILMLNYSKKRDFVDGGLGVLVCGLDDLQRDMLVPSAEIEQVSPRCREVDDRRVPFRGKYMLKQGMSKELATGCDKHTHVPFVLDEPDSAEVSKPKLADNAIPISIDVFGDVHLTITTRTIFIGLFFPQSGLSRETHALDRYRACSRHPGPLGGLKCKVRRW
jgi:hypothetical protein